MKIKPWIPILMLLNIAYALWCRNYGAAFVIALLFASERIAQAIEERR
jgi:hypothetical protein